MGFYFKMLDQLRKVCGVYIRLSNIQKPRALLEGLSPRILPFLRYGPQKEGETKCLINDNHQAFWSLFLCKALN